MKRPIGVTLLALGAGLLALFEIWRTCFMSRAGPGQHDLFRAVHD